MAWFAELKRRKWYCIKGTFMVQWFSKLLYDEWWDSLSDDQKAAVERRREEERLDNQIRVNTCIMELGILSSIVPALYRIDK